MKAALMHFFRHPKTPWDHWFSRDKGAALDGSRTAAGSGSLALKTLNRPRVGLVLSAGAAKGLAHIGVIQVLEEEGIQVDVVAGTSMGAYVGGIWAAGHDGRALQDLATELKTARDRFELLDPAFPPRRGFLRGRRIEQRLRKTLAERRIEHLPKELHIIATELDTFRRRIFSDGDLTRAICASIAIPGIIMPVDVDGTEYVDGGVADPLPVGVIRDKVDVVIAVSVIPTVDDLESFRTPEALPSRLQMHWWRRILAYINRHLNYFARGNLLDILRKAAYGAQIRLIERSARDADVFIQIAAVDANWHNYHYALDYIAQGREAARQALPDILEAMEEAVELEPVEEKQCA